MMAALKGALRSLTIWFNSLAIAIVTGLPMAQDAFPQLQAYLPPDAYRHAMAAIIVANILLRFRTTQALADKVPK